MGRDLPTGTVTLLFTDIEGSTQLLHELGEQAYDEALSEHRTLLRSAFTAHGGVEVDTQGDALFYAFPDAREACLAALDGQDALCEGRIRVRMGLHTGHPRLSEEGYVGEDVHLGARIGAAGHGRQVLLSVATRHAAGVDAMDLGEHRLKDFDQGVWIFQLTNERFPPLKTISNTNLPRPLSSFVGREQEVKRVASLLQNGERLLTLTGPGGSGKTRLAIEAASDVVSEFSNGVFWVELAPIREAALVMETIATTLGAVDDVAAHIKNKHMLLVLDNFEQVADAARDVSNLLASCLSLRMLVTSRELLRVQGEVEYPVPPLERDEALELFCSRSGLEADDTITELCRRLDNLPLAVELAASRARVLSPAQILERLRKRLDLFKGGRDADPRQSTLRATIGWSHDLLTDEEKQLFARLSVFAGGCTLEAAEGIAEADLDTLQSLVDKSLVRHSDDRFWMLETIREFAAERLDESAEAGEIRRRHADHFLVFAESMEEFNLRGYQRPTLEALAEEHDNIRAAIDRFESTGETQNMLRLTAAMMPFWRDRGFPTEGWRRVVRALDTDEQPTRARALALEYAGEAAVVTGQPALGLRYAEEAVKIRRDLADIHGLGGSLNALGISLWHTGEREAARRPLEEAAAVFREAGDEHSALWADRSLAWCYHRLGLMDQARELHERNFARAGDFGDDGLRAVTAGALASLAMDEGRLGDAFGYLAAGLVVWKDYGDLLETPREIGRAARGLALAGKAVTAAKLLSCSRSYLEARGIGDIDLVRESDETVALIRAQLDAKALEQAWEQGRMMTEDEAVELALETLEEGPG